MQDSWYLYDNLNRIVLTGGIKSGNAIVSNGRGSTTIGYDGNGNRAFASYLPGPNPLQIAYYNYRYTPDHQVSQIYSSTTTSGGTLVDDRVYDQAGRSISDTAYSTVNSVTTRARRQLYYNSNGQLITQLSDKSTNNGVSYLADSLVRYSTTASATPTVAAAATDLGTYGATGLVGSYTAAVNTDTTAAYEYTNTYTYDYLAFGSNYKEARQQATTTLSGYTPGRIKGARSNYF